MSKASIIKLQGKLFAINLTWYEFNSFKELKQTTKLLKTNHGISFSTTVQNQDGFKEKKLLVGLSFKKLSKCYSLSSIVANKLKSGIFITDKLNFSEQEDISNKLYWVCIFQNNQVIANINLLDNISISGDELLSDAQVEKLINTYTKDYKVSIFVDLIDQSSLKISNTQIKSLNKIVSARIPNKYLIRKIHNNYNTYILVSMILGLSLITIIGYYQKAALNDKLQQQKIIELQKPQQTPEELIFKDIQINSASIILNSLDKLLKEIPVVIAGWDIQSISYTSNDPDNIQILYQRSDGMDIANAHLKAQELITKYNFDNASILFSNNHTVMQLKIKFPKIFIDSITSLNAKQIAKDINNKNTLKTIASIQQVFLNYRLGTIKPIYDKYSSQIITISNIDSLVFKALTELSNKHNNLVVSSIFGQFDSDFNCNWEFNGSIYA